MKLYQKACGRCGQLMPDPPATEPETYKVPYPFVDLGTDVVGKPDNTWRPGIRYEQDGPETSSPVADAMGTMVLTVISRYRPPGYQEKTFFKRRFYAPDGTVQGDKRLHMTSSWYFKKLCKGYQHDFDLVDELA